MAAGIFYGQTANAVIEAKIQWQAVADAVTCSSTVTAGLWLRRTNSWSGTATTGQNALVLHLDGQATKPAGGVLTVPNNGSWVLACEGTVTVFHEDDGTRSVPIKASGGLTGCSVKWVECAGVAELEVIPRGSVIGSFTCDTGFLDGKLTAAIQPAQGAVGHRLSLLHGQTLLQEIADSDAFGLSREQLAQVYRAVTQADQATLTLRLDTYTDAACTQQLGVTHTRELTLAIPQNSDTLPQLRLEAAPWGVQLQGLYIQNKTGIQAGVSAGASYGAAVSVALSVDGTPVELTDGGYRSALLTEPGKRLLQAAATDSRGFTVREERELTVLPYTEPRLTVRECCRCNEAVIPTDKGLLLYVNALAEHSQLPVPEPDSGEPVDANPCGLYVRVKPVAACAYGPERELLGETCALYGDQEGLAADTSYHVQIVARDRVGSETVTTFLIPTVAVQCHEGDGFLALGTYADGPGVDIAAHWPVRIRSENIYIYVGNENEKQPVSLADYIRKIINGGS